MNLGAARNAPLSTIDSIEPKRISPSGLDLNRLDADAVRSVQRLGSRGFEAYLVGGCIRDLLLDRDPKDFDIATEARPQQVKRAFTRNCRIIGRRFKLAHLHFDGNRKILEVATFRSTPEEEPDEADDNPVEEDRAPDPDGDADSGPEFDDSKGEDSQEVDPDGEESQPGDGNSDLLIVRDNEFGTVEEDAVRRDFTINALFLDPVRDEIIDYVGGMQDVEDRLIRTIGDPETRFREDPVRILRAAKFAGRLRFHFDGPTWNAMCATSEDLARAAPPRVLEEILRLLRAGHALPSFQILHEVGGLSVLLPDVARYLAESNVDERRIFWRLLDALDNHVDNGNTPSSAVTLGCLFVRPILQRFEQSEHRSLTKVVEEVIGPLAQELRLPRQVAGALKRICSVHPRFTATGKRRFRLASFLNDPHFDEALELFELSCYATTEGFEQLEHWRALRSENRPEASAPPQTSRSQGRGRGREESPRDGQSRGGRDEQKRKSKSPKKQKRQEKEKEKKPSKQRDKAPKRDTKKKRKPNKADEVLTIEPEAYDLSAFDRELAPREVPQFDTLVEAVQKKRRQPQLDESDTYKPPPPPGSDGDAPPPPPSSDVFGDW